MRNFGKFLELCWYTAELPGQPAGKRIAARAVLMAAALAQLALMLVVPRLAAYGLYRLMF